MITIKLKDYYEAKLFSWGDLEGWEFVETVDYPDTQYKDFMTATTIAIKEDTGDHYALDWDKYTSYYGSGEHEFPNLEVYQVKKETITVVSEIWSPVA
jgi:hypothetical protein